MGQYDREAEERGETELAFWKINQIGLVLSFWTHETNLLVHLLNPHHKAP